VGACRSGNRLRQAFVPDGVEPRRGDIFVGGRTTIQFTSSVRSGISFRWSTHRNDPICRPSGAKISLRMVSTKISLLAELGAKAGGARDEAFRLGGVVQKDEDLVRICVGKMATRLFKTH
jgi:hypothetical protein